MREILFRGKVRKSFEWIFGDFLAAGTDGVPWILPTSEKEEVKVLPETVGQYTGMTDKNGVKIFEGDIVRDNGGTVYPVIWGGTGFYLKYDPLHAHGFHYDLLPLCNYWHAQGAIIEVVGNIHDNPELLNGGSNNA